jgi:hypothetical protein
MKPLPYVPLVAAALSVAAGLFAGWVDFHNDEPQPAVLVILVAGGFLGLLAPHRAWLWAIIIALGIPAAYLIGGAIGAAPRAPVEPNIFGSLLALIPAFLATYAGVLARKTISTFTDAFDSVRH